MKFKENKKVIMIGSMILLVALVAILLWWFLRSKPEIIAPGEENMEELTDRLTPDNANPLTEEEKAELEGLLEDLTPDKPKALTEDQKSALEDLLNDLTPR
jgi:flagellar biosynthesis/type III secretory pathway M-ring protein FliF/YscJ